MLGQRFPQRTAFGLALLAATFLPAQSLKETADWLQDFVKVEASVSNLNWRDHYRVLIHDCHVTIYQDTEDRSCARPENKAVCRGDFPYVSTNHFKQEFSLKNIDLARIAVAEEPSFRAYAVRLTTVNERPLVVHSIKLGTQFMKADEEHEAYVVLRTREAAERVAKAFRRASSLCGATSSPF